MRNLVTFSLLAGVAFSSLGASSAPVDLLMVQPEGPQPAGQNGLCRRAAPLPPLPPEPPVPSQNQQNRWESRDGAMDVMEPPALAVPAPEPAPPPPPPPPMMAPPAPSAESSVVVTGSRSREAATPAKRAAPSAVAADVASAPPPPDSSFAPRRGPQPQSGLLTAGEHDDLLNPELYARYVDGFLKSETLQGVPRVDTRRVLTVAVKDNAGRPVPFARVKLTCADGNSLTMATLADGTAAFFPELDRLGSSVRVSVSSSGQAAAERSVSIAGAPGAQLHSVTLNAPAAQVRQFDLAVVIDTTGSMGDELEYLKAELLSIVGDIRARHPQLDVRLALIPYRDEGDEYVTRTFAFTPNLPSIQGRLKQHFAGGGGDYPEAVEQAMARAVSLQWRPNAIKSLLLVADAPPHAEDVASTWAAAEVARSKRIQIVPVAASGVAEGAEYLMRAMAASTQSRYLFLTDDSGIGNPHAPPAIDCYLVTRLDALIRRTLDSQISGRRIEPKDGELIRTVGTYDKGRCVLPPEVASAN